MTRLSSHAASTVRQFASAMDVDPFEAPDGSFSFAFERSGRLSVVAGNDGVIVISLTGRLLLEGLAAMALHAGRGGHDPRTGRVVQTGVTRAGQPVLMLRQPERGFDLPTLQKGFEYLAARIDAA